MFVAATVLPPASSPCGSCPYRRDVPSGVWSAEEYAKLPGYDLPTGYQPIGEFLCHRVTGHLCAGWVGCHDMEENLALRISLAKGEISPGLYASILAYRSPVPLFASGAEACAHGLTDIDNPGPAARALIAKLPTKGSPMPYSLKVEWSGLRLRAVLDALALASLTVPATAAADQLAEILGPGEGVELGDDEETTVKLDLTPAELTAFEDALLASLPYLAADMIRARDNAPGLDYFALLAIQSQTSAALQDVRAYLSTPKG